MKRKRKERVQIVQDRKLLKIQNNVEEDEVDEKEAEIEDSLQENEEESQINEVDHVKSPEN